VRVESKTVGGFRLAVDDIATAIQLRPLWVRLGWNDILLRYRRSALGPFWLTASTMISIVALGIVYSQIFNMPVRELMPHVCVGLIVWSFISAIMLEAGDLFVGSEGYIKQIRLPYSLYAFRFVLSKAIIFVHDVPIYVALLLYFGIWPGAAVLFAIPGFVLLLVNGVMTSITLGVVSARFRDIPRIIASLTQIVFLITPIIWKPELLGPRGYLASANPFFHLIEMVRAPLLGSVPSMETVMVAILITAINGLVAMTLFSRYRNRIAYWV
jgi:ABC-2 type transport system permease protein/lipopolysaccharide transport system permease protein